MSQYGLCTWLDFWTFNPLLFRFSTDWFLKTMVSTTSTTIVTVTNWHCHCCCCQLWCYKSLQLHLCFTFTTACGAGSARNTGRTKRSSDETNSYILQYFLTVLGAIHSIDGLQKIVLAQGLKWFWNTRLLMFKLFSLLNQICVGLVLY